MAARAITYIWKYPRPTDQSRALKLMAAAYQTAVATDPNTTSIMIRYVADKTVCGDSPSYLED